MLFEEENNNYSDLEWLLAVLYVNGGWVDGLVHLLFSKHFSFYFVLAVLLDVGCCKTAFVDFTVQGGIYTLNIKLSL